jgi:hypothetical protein
MHFAIDENDLQRIRDCLLRECNVSHVFAPDESEKQNQKNKQCDSCICCDSCILGRAAHVVINGLEAIGQEAHVRRLLFELGDVSLTHSLQLRRVA